jgi:hypothetical protein
MSPPRKICRRTPGLGRDYSFRSGYLVAPARRRAPWHDTVRLRRLPSVSRAERIRQTLSDGRAIRSAAPE